MKNILLTATLMLLASTGLSAQTVRDLVQSALRAHTRTAINDITATGNITVNGMTRATTVYVKGTGTVRIDNGTGSDRSVVIFDRGKGWAGAEPSRGMKPLTDHISVRRPMQFPFLDLIAEMDNPNVQITYQGLKTIGSRSVHHITVYVADPKASERLLRRPLDDQADFYIDTQSLLVLRSERLLRTEQDMNLRVPSITEFSDYRSINGVMVPFSIISTTGNSTLGMSQSTTTFTNVRINEGVADALFAVQSTGGRP